MLSRKSLFLRKKHKAPMIYPILIEIAFLSGIEKSKHNSPKDSDSSRASQFNERHALHWKSRTIWISCSTSLEPYKVTMPNSLKVGNWFTIVPIYDCIIWSYEVFRSQTSNSWYQMNQLHQFVPCTNGNPKSNSYYEDSNS